MARLLFLCAGLFGAAGVALGAFGAHALKGRLGPEMLQVWHTAVQYHLLHVLAVAMAGAWLLARPNAPWIGAAGWAWLAGIVVFSGSLYLLALTGAKWLGAVTPLGGVLLIAGWILMALAALRG